MNHAVDFAMRWGHLPIIGLIVAHMHGVRFRLNIWRNGGAVPRIRWSVYIERKESK